MPQKIDVPGVGVVEFPDGMSDDQIAAAIKANSPARPSFGDLAKREAMAFASPLRGVKDVIDTGAYGLAKLFGSEQEAARVKAMNDAGKADFERMTQSGPIDGPMAGVGRFAGQMASTAPAAGFLGGLVGKAAPRVGQAIAQGGFSSAPLPIAAAGGAASGMLSSALIDPESAAQGGLLGAALPMVGKPVSAAAQWAAPWLMQSAIKPTIQQLKSGDAGVAVKTLLDKGISPTKGGVEKLRGLISDKNDEIAQAIGGSTAQINKFAAARPLSETARKFTQQVNPSDDLNAITKAGLDFLDHPAYQGLSIPVQDAQKLKQGTYKILAKKYGQVGTAETEAQKALARGLKDEIASAVPGVKALNEQEAQLLKTLDVAERRALMELNKNPMGLSILSGSPGAWAAFMADRSAAFKALAARMIHRTDQAAGTISPAVGLSAGPASAMEY